MFTNAVDNPTHLCVKCHCSKGNFVGLGHFNWHAGVLSHRAASVTLGVSMILPRRPQPALRKISQWRAYRGMDQRKSWMTDAPCNSNQNATVHRSRGLRPAWLAVMACVASAFILLPWRSNGDDCWTDSGCLVAVNFPGWIGTPETCWQGPSIFPAEGAVGTYISAGELVAVQAPPWILKVGDGRQGSICILPNDGPERTNTVVFMVAISNTASQCSVVVRQAAAKMPAPRLISPTLIPGAAFQFGVVGATNQTCVIEASSDLLNWVPLATNSSASGSFTFSDATAANLAARFYRVAALP